MRSTLRRSRLPGCTYSKQWCIERYSNCIWV